MEWYVDWVKHHMLLSAFVQFALLGMLGELIPHYIREKRVFLPFKVWQLFAKMLAWGVLGIFVKYGFTGMVGFVEALMKKGLLPHLDATVSFWQNIGKAFITSFCLQLFFGPVLMYFHRMEDNLIAWRWDFSGMKTALLALIWFWLPVHTITFCLPEVYRIGLAALWSVALGIIMGTVTRKMKKDA